MSLSYELAKELKDAGFMQEGKGECIFGWNTPKASNYDGSTILNEEYSGSAYLPTLEELIEAVAKFGKHFKLASNFTINPTMLAPGWRAVSDPTNPDKYIVAKGDDPATATAKLWLALNKKA